MQVNWPWRRRVVNLPETWRAIADLPLDGHVIQPAKVGEVKPLKTKRAHEHEFMQLLKRRA